MKKILLSLFLIFSATVIVHAQVHETKFSIGPEVAVPTYAGITSNGIGGGVTLEYFLNKKVAVTGGISFNHFKGEVFNNFKHDTINGFSVMPVLFGAKYFIIHSFYVSGSAGVIVGLHNAGNHLALSPGVGIEIPVSSKTGVDVGVKLIGIPTGYSFSENSFLNKGGYSFLTCRLAYIF